MVLTLGIVGGSGLLKSNLEVFKTLHEEYVDTAHGRVFLRSGKLADGCNLVFVQRHDASASRAYTQPADVNYAAIALALKAKHCNFVLGTCSVGSLKPSLGVSSLVVPDDFYCPSDLRRVYTDYRAHFMPAVDETLRTHIIDILRAGGQHPVPHGTYVNSRGPRFETKAEIRVMAQAGDVVGMTAAHECSACCEVKLPYAMLCLVDNFANGIGPALSLALFHAAQAANLGTLETSLRSLLTQLPARLAADLAAAAAATAAPAVTLTLPAAAAAAHTGIDKVLEAGAGASPADMHARATASAAAAVPPTPVPTPVVGSPSVTHAPLHVSLLVHARYVVPVAEGRERQVLDHHTVAVAGSPGRIVDVLPTHAALERYTADRTVTLSEAHALMPGLVNAHTHLAMSLLRGVADDMPLAQWLTEEIWPTEARLVEPAFCAAGAQAALAELIRSGVTTVNDMYWFPAATAAAAEAAGLRALVGGVILEFPSAYAANAGEYIDHALSLVAAYHPGGAAAVAAAAPASTAAKAGAPAVAPSGRVTVALAPHAPYTVSDATFERIRDLSAALRLRVHLHLHETAGEVEQSISGVSGGVKHLSDALCSPVDNIKRLGLLNERLIAVHMVHLSDAEVASVAAAGASVVHCPNSNLKLASGFSPVAKLLAAGVNVALGTDGACSNNSLDFFQELKLAATLAKAVHRDAAALPAWQALRVATLNGAKALGLGSVCGSLEVGKAADMCAVDLGGVDQQPVFNVLSHLVYATSRSCVTDVWVDGVPLLEARRLTTIDEPAVLASMAAWAEKVRPGLTAADKRERLAPEHAKHVHTAAHGPGEAGKVHAASGGGSHH